MAFLELDNVSKIYRGNSLPVTALQEINLAVEPAEFICIAGPSGSGKSTLLNLMGILDLPTYGTVMIDGQSTSDLSKTEAALMRSDKLGFVFQSFNLIPVLSVWENIEYSLILRKITKKRKSTIREVLSAVGLADKMHKLANQLSGGEQQRVAIARAIAGNPGLVLADEPTANLDTGTGKSIIELFKTINGRWETTFIFSSHDQRISSLADRTLTLIDGRLLTSAK